MNLAIYRALKRLGVSYKKHWSIPKRIPKGDLRTAKE